MEEKSVYFEYYYFKLRKDRGNHNKAFTKRFT